MRLALLSALVAICVLVGGCVRSLQPVLEDQQVVTNDDVLGRWTPPENSKEFIEISRGESNTYKALYHDDKGKTGSFTVRLGKVESMLIAEVSPADEPSPYSDVYRAHFVPACSFYIVTQTKPSMVGKSLKPEWLKQYLAEHPDELQIVKGQDGVVSSSTHDLQTFLIKHAQDPKAFDEVTFVRSAATQPTTQP